MKVTAYDLCLSVENLNDFLNNNDIYNAIYHRNNGVHSVWLHYCDFYFEQEFIVNGVFQPKKELNVHETILFQHSPATIIDEEKILTYKGYRLGKI